MEQEKFKPIQKARSGRFQVTIWKRTKVIPVRADKADFDAEREVEQFRASVQYSIYNRYIRNWINKVIWCDSEDLRSLCTALDELNQFKEDEGDAK